MRMIVQYGQLEALFRRAVGMDLTENKAKEILAFVQKKLHDLLIIGERNAHYNDREVIWLSDLPITKGLRNSIRQFQELELEEQINLQYILDYLATQPPLKYPLEAELEEDLPNIVGGLLLTFARTLFVLTGGARSFDMEDVERAKEILDLTL